MVTLARVAWRRVMFGVYSQEAERILAKALREGGGYKGDDGTIGPEAMVLAMLDGPSAHADLGRRALDAHAVTYGSFENLLRQSGMVSRNTQASAEPVLDAEMNLC